MIDLLHNKSISESWNDNWILSFKILWINDCSRPLYYQNHVSLLDFSHKAISVSSLMEQDANQPTE